MEVPRVSLPAFTIATAGLPAATLLAGGLDRGDGSRGGWKGKEMGALKEVGAEGNCRAWRLQTETLSLDNAAGGLGMQASARVECVLVHM